jgi:hypothetical protein
MCLNSGVQITFKRIISFPSSHIVTGQFLFLAIPSLISSFKEYIKYNIMWTKQQLSILLAEKF